MVTGLRPPFGQPSAGGLRFAPAPVMAALTALRPYGRLFRGIRPAVGAFLSGSALPDLVSSGFRSLNGHLSAPGPLSVLWLLLTPHRVAPLGSPQVRTRWWPLPLVAAAQRGSRSPLRSGSRHDRRIYLRDWTLWALLCCASSPAASALICDFCPSACRFPLAFLPPIGYPFGVGFT